MCYATTAALFCWSKHGKLIIGVRFGTQQSVVSDTDLVVGCHDLARVLAGVNGGNDQAFVVNPGTFVELTTTFKSLFNDMPGLQRPNFHVFGSCSASGLAQIPQIPLELPAPFGKTDARAFLGQFCACDTQGNPRPGYVRCTHRPGAQPVDLPVWKAAPSVNYSPPKPRDNRGYTAATVRDLGFESFKAMTAEGTSFQATLQSSGLAEGRDRMTELYVHGADFERKTDKTDIRRRNRTLEPGSSVGLHCPEAYHNATAIPPRDANDADPVQRVCTVPGEFLAAFPVDAIVKDGRWVRAAKQFCEEHTDMHGAGTSD
eukprot:COSAG01_NODE_14400_length_1459_cov_1.816176_1_plen_316_part_00